MESYTIVLGLNELIILAIIAYFLLSYFSVFLALKYFHVPYLKKKLYSVRSIKEEIWPILILSPFTFPLGIVILISVVIAMLIALVVIALGIAIPIIFTPITYLVKYLYNIISTRIKIENWLGIK